MTRCTWKECEQDARHPQIAQGGEVWANLCDQHHQEMEAAIEKLDPKTLLRAWICAQGGAEAAAKRMTK